MSRRIGDALNTIFGAKSSAKGVIDPWGAKYSTAVFALHAVAELCFLIHPVFSSCQVRQFQFCKLVSRKNDEKNAFTIGLATEQAKVPSR